MTIMEIGKARTVEERGAASGSGLVGLLVLLALNYLFIRTMVLAFIAENIAGGITWMVLYLILQIAWNGLTIVPPNRAVVLILFGKYIGSVTRDGWHFVNPFVVKRPISLRVHNMNTERIKVNDAHGNPIEIAAVVVWRVVDTARASFDVEDYVEFVQIQAETAVRQMAAKYPYDLADDEGGASLRESADKVSVDLETELQERLQVAGIEVLEARLTHLAYSAEIAGVMLQRQQAAAIIAARKKIVDGAVSMVEMALTQLDESKAVELTQQDRAKMVSSLLIVLTSHVGAQPVLQAGGEAY